MQFMLRFLRIMRDYALTLAATNYAQYYAGIMYASLPTVLFMWLIIVLRLCNQGLCTLRFYLPLVPDITNTANFLAGQLS